MMHFRVDEKFFRVVTFLYVCVLSLHVVNCGVRSHITKIALGRLA